MNKENLKTLATRMAFDRLTGEDRFYILRTAIEWSDGFDYGSEPPAKAESDDSYLLFRTYKEANRMLESLKRWFTLYPEESEVPYIVMPLFRLGKSGWEYVNGWNRQQVKNAVVCAVQRFAANGEGIVLYRLSLPEPHHIFDRRGPFGLPGLNRSAADPTDSVPENAEEHDRTYIFKSGEGNLSFAVHYENDVCFYIAKDAKANKESKSSMKSNEKTDGPNDAVDHPKHYTKGGIEVIDVISAFTQGLDGEEAFCAGNAIKYLCRWQDKNGVEDLKKAQWYVARLISLREE